MEFISNNTNVFRLLLRKYSGTSTEFRAAVAREIQYFITELAEYLQQKSKYVSALYRNISKSHDYYCI